MEKVNLRSNQSVKSETYQSFLSVEGNRGNCLHRSVITQQEQGLDINFGFILVKSKYVISRVLLDNCTIKGWCVPYDFHTWNEDDNDIYDDIKSLNEHGMELPKNPKVVVIDWNDKTFISHNHFFFCQGELIKSLQYRKDIDMVYVCGYSDNATLNCLVDWDIFEYMIHDSCDIIKDVTGTTMNNVVI